MHFSGASSCQLNKLRRHDNDSKLSQCWSLFFKIKPISDKSAFIIQSVKLMACVLLLVGFTQSAHALSFTLDGTRTVLSGTDCGTAPTTYRFGTTASWQGTALDIIVRVNSEDNDYVLGTSSGGGRCVYASGGVLSINLRDKDAGDNVAFIDTTITIVRQGTTTPVFVDRITATGFDLDHNGQLAPNTSSTDTEFIYLGRGHLIFLVLLMLTTVLDFSPVDTTLNLKVSLRRMVTVQILLQLR